MSALQARSLSLSILSIVKLLERFGYYGMRSILILYIIDEAELGINREDALYYYGTFTAGVYLFNLPMGLISDFLLKQRNGTIIGLSIFLLGYLLLIIPNIYAVFGALLLISIGGGLVNPNLIVMVGRLYDKRDHRRNIGFAIFIILINVGAFLSSLIMTFVQQNINYHFCFVICAIALLFALVIFIIFAKNMEVKEYNVSGEKSLSIDQHPEILDYKTSIQPPPLKHLRNTFSPGRIIVLFLLTALVAVFWQLYEIIGGQQIELLPFGTSFSFFGADIPFYTLKGVLDTLVFIGASILLIVAWMNDKLRNSIIVIAGGFLFLLLGMLGLYFFKEIGVTSSNLIFLVFFMSGMLGIADACLTTVALSYVTRLSHVRFSSTMVGFYLLGTGLGVQMINLIGLDFSIVSLIIVSIIPVLIIVFLLIGRNFLKEIADNLG